ncbi:MAG: hypothetical protein JO025_27045 [Verrucomicrobia bacterium]|nr:hypothetical protein [Verrucomicrobiota bacterium]
MPPPKDTLSELKRILALNDYPGWAYACDWYGLVVQDKDGSIDFRLLIFHPIRGTYTFRWDLAGDDFTKGSLRKNQGPRTKGYSTLDTELIQRLLNPKYLADLAKSFQLDPPAILKKLSDAGVAVCLRCPNGTLKPKFRQSGAP